MQYWLLKSEPETFSIDDLANAPRKTTCWDGVRNYQARNFMRDQMKVGDQVFFYHSSCAVPGIAGIASVVKAGYPDHTALDPTHSHFDPESNAQQPRWFMVDIKLKCKFEHIVTLERLRAQRQLKNLVILKRGNRLSVTPVLKSEWDFILSLTHNQLETVRT